MLSFELSAIDLILTIAVIILLMLYITKASAKPLTDEKPLVKKKNASEKPAMETTISEEGPQRLMITHPHHQTGSERCPYSFGYLTKLDNGAPIPDGCLGCSRIIACYTANK